MTKSISILGSTGSIGLSTLKIIDKKNHFKVNILSANKNYSTISIKSKYKPKIFIINNFETFEKIKIN